MAFRGIYSVAKPILGRAGAIVKSGTKAGNPIPKVTPAGKGLAAGGVLKTLGRVARPALTGATVLGTGAGLVGLGEYIVKMPGRIEDETVATDYRLGRDKKGYDDQLNMIQKLLVNQFGSGVDALKDRRDLEEQERQSKQFADRIRLGVRGPTLGETDAAYEASTGRKYRSLARQAERVESAADAAANPILQAELSRTRLAADRMYQMQLDQLDEKIASREDANDLLRLQLANSNSQFERELAYRQEESRRDRTAKLIGALSSLGSAFVI